MWLRWLYADVRCYFGQYLITRNDEFEFGAIEANVLGCVSVTDYCSPFFAANIEILPLAYPTVAGW